MGWQMRYDIKVYGSDTNLSTEYPTLASVTGLTDVVTYSPEALGAYMTGNYEDKGDKYLGGVVTSGSSFRLQWELQVKGVAFPDPSTSYADQTAVTDFYPINVFTKKYHYLYLGDKYPLQPNISATDTCVAVAITGIKITSENGFKKLSIEMQKRYNGV